MVTMPYNFYIKWHSSKKTACRSDMRFLRYKALKSVMGSGRAGPGREYSDFSLKYERTRSAHCARSLVISKFSTTQPTPPPRPTHPRCWMLHRLRHVNYRLGAHGSLEGVGGLKTSEAYHSKADAFAWASGGEGPVLQSLSALGLNASSSTNRAMHDFVTKLALLSKMLGSV